MKYYLFIFITYQFFFTSCKHREKEEKFISNFDNEVFLKAKHYFDTSSINFFSGTYDSIAYKIIGQFYDKEKSPNINDTIILQTYKDRFGDSEDYFCDEVNYYLKRRAFSLNPKTGKIERAPFGILSANIESSLPKFIHFIDSSLKVTYFKTVQHSKQFQVSLDIQLDHCRISKIVINADKGLDKNIINELYKIIYTSPKWKLDEVDANTEEKLKESYVRNKKLNINLNILNDSVSLINYTVDSTIIDN